MFILYIKHFTIKGIYWNEIESKKKHQKEIIIEEIKNNPNQIGMGC